MSTIIPNTDPQSISSPTQIECPSWCTVTAAEHLNDREGFEGRHVHRGTVGALQVATSTWPDGTPDGDAPEVQYGDHTLSPVAARAFAADLVKAADLIDTSRGQATAETGAFSARVLRNVQSLVAARQTLPVDSLEAIADAFGVSVVDLCREDFDASA